MLLLVCDIPAQTISISGDSVPRFKGGDKALYTFLHKHTRYPSFAKKEEIRGTVIIQFRVDYLGEMKDVVAIQLVAPSLDQEALRVIALLQGHWEASERIAGPATGTRVINFQFGIP
jgi:TonB family protein